MVDPIPLLDIDEEVAGVAEVFVREYLMPSPAVGDAVHVAVCTVHEVDYLLAVERAALSQPQQDGTLAGDLPPHVGLVPPVIITPDLLWEA